jgi:hypothetical protein
MDSDQIIKRLEIKQEHLNRQRLDERERKGWADAIEFVINTICVLEQAEEKAEEEEVRLEAYLEAQEEWEG